ncbi:alpha-2,8-polysialyltransferase family protein [Pseudogemmobacter faecipullorum]|uniref:Uncharacterized protein n=1 Tax=Pseudogemmobacter faecipullorum TaxID=2755041 RepID=A0ABS8CGF1_9RHOB|nr:alpha-2,8-polysialyltransferase family protein [Pseudogemmobacter faecipullorum]MCB5408457.1 hypothetical protein [Pseudogemmobacter faecipullorum]
MMKAVATAPDLYLAPSSRPLLFSYISALLSGHAAEIVYMNDYAPLPEEVRLGLIRAFPDIHLSVRRDSDCIEEFATLPRWMPALLRRNFAPGASGLLAGPADRPPEWLGPGYRNAYIYVTGPFMMKTLRRRCQSIILREEGLGNYHSQQIPPVKALARAARGLSPFRQWMGEEDWVDRIEIARPEALPPGLRRKAAPRQVFAMMEQLPDAAARRLVQAFWPGPAFGGLPMRSALILSQPLAGMGMMSAPEAERLYAEMAGMLRQAGYSVMFKTHPQERARREGALPGFFPIEAWRWLHPEKFDLAVALCSAALDEVGSMFSRDQLQLCSPREFGRNQVSGWRSRLERALS